MGLKNEGQLLTRLFACNVVKSLSLKYILNYFLKYSINIPISKTVVFGKYKTPLKRTFKPYSNNNEVVILNLKKKK